MFLVVDEYSMHKPVMIRYVPGDDQDIIIKKWNAVLFFAWIHICQIRIRLLV